MSQPGRRTVPAIAVACRSASRAATGHGVGVEPVYACAVILRVLTATVATNNIGSFNDLLRAQLVELRTQPGLAYVKLARRLLDGGGEEVVLVEEWLTPGDLFAWTRGQLDRPRLLPGTEDLVEDLIISHYEALDLTPEELGSRLLGQPPP